MKTLRTISFILVVFTFGVSTLVVGATGIIILSPFITSYFIIRELRK